MISESLERFNSKFKAQRGFNFRLNLKRLQIIPVPPLSSFRTGPFQVSAKISHCNTRPIYAVVYPILLFIQTGPNELFENMRSFCCSQFLGARGLYSRWAVALVVPLGTITCSRSSRYYEQHMATSLVAIVNFLWSPEDAD